MTKQRKRIIFLIPVLMLLVIAAIVFTEINKKPETGNDELPINQIENISLGYDYAVAGDLSDMVAAADVVVVGKYVGYDSSWNMCRNPNNISEEDSKRYIEGHLYTFTVEEVLKGDAPTGDILVNQRYADTRREIESNAVINSEGVITKAATVENEILVTIHNPLYISPELEVTYILFLYEDKNFGIYSGPMEPFSIKIAPDNTVELQSSLINKVGPFEEIVQVGENRSINVSISSMNLDDFVGNVSVDSVKQQIAQIMQSGG